MELTQLGAHPVAGSLTFAKLGEAMFSAGSFSGKIRATGVMSDTKVTIGTLLETEGPNSKWSYETRCGDIAVTPPEIAHEGCYSNRLSYVTLALPLEMLVEQCERCENSINEAFWRQPAMYRPPQLLARQLVERLKTCVRTIAGQPSILYVPEAREAVFDDLMEAMLKGYAAVTANSPTPRRCLVSSSRTVERVDEYLRAHTHCAVRLSELCRYLKMSERTLHRVFTEYMDLPPRLYMHRWRLSQVRAALAAPEHGDLKVGDVAASFGLWELGRFAGDYRQMFGERPSETLKNAQSVRAQIGQSGDTGLVAAE